MRLSLSTIARTDYPWKRFPWRAPVTTPPHEESISLEVAALCACNCIYDERIGRCPRCAETHSLKLVTVLNRDGGEAVPREEN